MSDLRSNLQIGSRVDGGHFGEVHLGHDDVHGQVAVKVISQQLGESAADWQARKDGLLAEGQHLSEAEHPNVVPVFHLVESAAGDALHLVMQWCDGGSLQSAFEDGPMTLGAVRKCSTEVALGLQALHLRDMLHRDIKPGNILLDGTVARLGDFGLVTDRLLLGYGSQAGYSDHIAPEVWNGAGTSARSDIWALGMTIYRLLHGEEWYSRSAAPRDLVARGGFRETLRWLPHVPKEWRRFIRRMLDDEPHTRYQTVGQVMTGLATLPTEPAWTCTVTPTEITWQRPGRGREFFVVWTKYGARIYDWRAWSEPIGPAGNKRTLGKSNGRVGHVRSEHELRDFFATHS